jgi:hypothetical protein
VSLDKAKLEFLAELRAKAKKKRQEQAAKRKRAPAKVKPPSTRPASSTKAMLAEIRDSVRSLVKTPAVPDGSSVEFAVTERDENGKIKSFKVTT